MRRKRVVVVGAGLAGLTAAAYALKAGHETLVLERSDSVGGLVGSFSRSGFYFDCGPRAFENSGIVLPMARGLGLDVTFRKSPVTVGIEDKLVRFRSMADARAYERALNELFPASGDDLGAVFDRAFSYSGLMRTINGVDNPFFRGPLSDPGYAIRKPLPWFPSFILAALRLANDAESIEAFLMRTVSAPSLREMLSQHFFKGTSAAFALGYFHTFLDYHYPEGGTARLPAALAERLTERGGTIQRGREAKRVDLRANEVIDQDGVARPFDALVWAADLKALYRCVDASSLDGRSRAAFERERESYLRGRGGESAFCLYLAVDEPPETFARLSDGHFLYTPSRIGLGPLRGADQDALVERFPRGDENRLLAWIREFCARATLEIGIPCLRDPGLAPEGKTGLTASLLVDGRLFSAIRETDRYEFFKAAMEDAIIDALASSLYPFLRSRLLFKASSTPATLERLFGVSDGAITGWSLEEEVPAPSDLFGAFASPGTALPRILKAGQWAYSPAGVPTAALTGRLAARRLG